MNFSLTPNLEQFVREKATGGEYNNASEVVREALRIMKRVEEQRELKMQNLRKAIKAGDDDISRGDFAVISSQEDLDMLFAEL